MIHIYKFQSFEKNKNIVLSMFFSSVKNFFLAGLLLFFFLLSSSFAYANESLHPEDAFKAEISAVTPEKISLSIAVQPGYYLYSNQFFSVKSPTQGLKIINIVKSPSTDKNDKFSGNKKVWEGGTSPVKVDVYYNISNAKRLAQLSLTYQGCHDGVLCYPPQKRYFDIKLPQTNDRLLGSLQTSSEKTKKARSSILSLKKKSDKPLPQDQAFSLSLLRTSDKKVLLIADIAPHHYLYQKKFAIDASNNISSIDWMKGEPHYDQFFGEQEIYRGKQTVARLSLKNPDKAISFTITFQGCADRGICYPKATQRMTLDTNGKSDSVKASSSQSKDDVMGFTEMLNNNVWLGIGALLLAGIALSFTPCVLPMLPILLGIITNQRKVSKVKAFSLSSAYMLGIATMMAVFGLVVAQAGINIQLIFQQPLWLILFASVFIAMGLAMMGVFNLAMPSGIQSKIINWQNRFQDSTFLSVFIVGALSTLVVGPCVAPPLIAVLAFISTTHDSLLGALYLFSLGIGMGIPLVVFSSLVTTVPKSGALAKFITRLFAMLMLGVGLWLLNRLLPGFVSLILWGLFVTFVAWSFYSSEFTGRKIRVLMRLVSLVLVLVGGAWIAGGILGNSNPVKPFTKSTELPFINVRSTEELYTLLQKTNSPIMMDFYADWCISCQEFKYFTLADSKVANALAGFTLLKVDITNMSDDDKALLNMFDLIGPPAVLFFENGQELREKRIVGEVNTDDFLQHLESLK